MLNSLVEIWLITVWTSSSDWLAFASANIGIKACEKASKSLIRDFGEIEKLQVSIKGPSDFVSSADKKVEETLIQELQKARPDYSILSEEIGEIKKNSEYRWIIDPIDGTLNFLHGIPHFAISIGLEKKKWNNFWCNIWPYKKWNVFCWKRSWSLFK